MQLSIRMVFQPPAKLLWNIVIVSIRFRIRAIWWVHSPALEHSRDHSVGLLLEAGVHWPQHPGKPAVSLLLAFRQPPPNHSHGKKGRAQDAEGPQSQSTAVTLQTEETARRVKMVASLSRTGNGEGWSRGLSFFIITSQGFLKNSAPGTVAHACSPSSWGG